MTLCEKYRPKKFSEIKGQENAIARLIDFIKRFPRKKAIILYGPTGSGKTSLAYALASEIEAEVVEINASDLRDKESVEKIIGEASKQKSLFAEKKILLLDEIDGITKDDKGGIQEVIRILKKTNFPIILTANDIWDKKFSELRKSAEMIEVKELDYKEISEILKDICKKENLEISGDLLTSLAVKARGDARAAINDLQTINKEVTQKDLDERDKEEKIFNVLRRIFKQLPDNETLFLYDKVNMSLDEIFLWLEENIPKEYKGEELYKAIEALSKADIFRGRIYRHQHWRFLIYQNFLLSAGISSAKNQVKLGFTPYKRPSRILKIWIINQKFQQKRSIAEKYAQYTHTNVKRAMNEFPLIKKIINSNKDIQKQLKLTEEEIKFLNS